MSAVSAVVVVLAHTTSVAVLPFLAPVVVLGGALAFIVVSDRRRSRR